MNNIELITDKFNEFGANLDFVVTENHLEQSIATLLSEFSNQLALDLNMENHKPENHQVYNVIVYTNLYQINFSTVIDGDDICWIHPLSGKRKGSHESYSLNNLNWNVTDKKGFEAVKSMLETIYLAKESEAKIKAKRTQYVNDMVEYFKAEMLKCFPNGYLISNDFMGGVRFIIPLDSESNKVVSVTYDGNYISVGIKVKEEHLVGHSKTNGYLVNIETDSITEIKSNIMKYIDEQILNIKDTIESMQNNGYMEYLIYLENNDNYFTQNFRFYVPNLVDNNREHLYIINQVYKGKIISFDLDYIDGKYVGEFRYLFTVEKVEFGTPMEVIRFVDEAMIRYGNA